MRAILLGLVLLNALYWAWSHWVDTPPAAPVRGAEFADLPTLQLISEVTGPEGGITHNAELNLEDVQPLITIDAGPTALAGSDRAAESGPVGDVSGATDIAAAVPEPPVAGSQSAESPVPELQDTGLSDSGQSASNLSESESESDSDSESESSGNVAPGEVTTVSGAAELSPDSITATTRDVTVDLAVNRDTPTTNNRPLLASGVVTNGDPIANPSRCDSVGPFLSLRQARAAVVLLNGAGVATQQRVEDAEVWVGHWVHLPPYPTREAAVAVVERLRREGVKDIYIETTEELRNSVSLGLFSDIEGAEIRAGKVRKLGVRPQIVDRRRDGLVYWVDSELKAGSSIDIGLFDVLPHQTLRVESVTCTGRLNARQ